MANRNLNPPEEKFVLHWGEMGTKWGINRTVAQIFALLFISKDPLNAEDISETLSVARSTVSTGLSELLSWQLIRVTHKLGDRRDHYQAVEDVWESFRLVLEERKRREMDPTLQVLRETVGELETSKNKASHPYHQLSSLLNFFEIMLGLYSQFQKISMSNVKRLASSANIIGRVAKFIENEKGGA